MSLNINQIENVRDTLRQWNYEIPEEWDNDDIAKFIEVILDALNLELPEDALS